VPELFHFSEKPGIEVFAPHVSQTAATAEPLVWAVDAEHQPAYWFPRDCPRVTIWKTPGTSREDHERFFGSTSADRVHAIEAAWLRPMREVALYAYRLPDEPFELHDEPGGFWVSRVVVRPLAREPVGDLLDRHAAAGIELRILPSLWPLHDAAVGSTVGFSMIRLRNARGRDDGL
jgi:hypothetical protein